MVRPRNGYREHLLWRMVTPNRGKRRVEHIGASRNVAPAPFSYLVLGLGRRFSMLSAVWSFSGVRFIYPHFNGTLPKWCQHFLDIVPLVEDVQRAQSVPRWINPIHEISIRRQIERIQIPRAHLNQKAQPLSIGAQGWYR